jgi:hypothetical protein
MVVLNFTLTEEGVAVLHDALACMFKFSDDVCMEARNDKVSAALDVARAAHAIAKLLSALVDSDCPEYLQIGIHPLHLRGQ